MWKWISVFPKMSIICFLVFCTCHWDVKVLKNEINIFRNVFLQWNRITVFLVDCTVELLQYTCRILTFYGKAKPQTHSAFENLPVLRLSSVTSTPQPAPLSSCHASGHPAISTGPHVLHLWASLIKLWGPQHQHLASFSKQPEEGKGRKGSSIHAFILF